MMADLALRDGWCGEIRAAVPAGRLAFRFTPATLRACLPRGVVGAYLLLDGETPIYVGRSDTCLRERLATHNHARHATHVLWEPTGTTSRAFHLEAFWYHRHHATLLNQVHPAAPAFSAKSCPFCSSDLRALGRALGRNHDTPDSNITERTQ